jgi:8-oxo-dGTP pyrophosphatase MutT (NUDIX family)
LITRHFTATAYILAEGKVVLHKHQKLGMWLPPGGHVEENETPAECAKREAKEECGLEIEIIRQENIWIERWNAVSTERPYMCLIENIPEHGTHAAHQHIDFLFLAKPVGGTLLPGHIWFGMDEVLALEDDVSIFSETKMTILHILEKYQQLLAT